MCSIVYASEAARSLSASAASPTEEISEAICSTTSVKSRICAFEKVPPPAITVGATLKASCRALRASRRVRSESAATISMSALTPSST